jgi:hypothetical protein
MFLAPGLLLLTVYSLPAHALLLCDPATSEPLECSQNSCKGLRYCEGYSYGACIPTNASTISCQVCGRSGFKTCSGFTVDPDSCDAYQSELCNQCDDDGDGAIDEGLTGGPCTMPNGCSGVVACSANGPICVWSPGSRKTCASCGEGGTAACRPDGSFGPCQAATASIELPCNGCDDDLDGVEIGHVGAAELCNGMDDNCDGRLDEGPRLVEGEVCQISAACTCQPTTCAALGKNCGAVSDGCGGALNCGNCMSPQTCGGGGVSNVCGCQPLPQWQACQGKTCGTAPDGCGGTVTCGTCMSGQVCLPTQNCCTPMSQAVACKGRVCGTVSDGCGGTYLCGTCAKGQVCQSGACEDDPCNYSSCLPTE